MVLRRNDSYDVEWKIWIRVLIMFHMKVLCQLNEDEEENKELNHYGGYQILSPSL